MTDDQNNSGLYTLADALQQASSREFYMSYEDLLQDFTNTWRGLVKHNGEWIPIDPENPTAHRIMSEEAIGWVTGILRNFLSVPNRLSDHNEETIPIYAYKARKHIARMLHTVGWRKHGIPIEYLRLISFECGQLIHSALTWSKNAGGFKRLNTNIRSVESLSQVIQDRSMGKEDNEYIPKTKPW